MGKRKRQASNKESQPRREGTAGHEIAHEPKVVFEPEKPSDDPYHHAEAEPDQTEQIWLWGSRAILIVAALLRFTMLTFKPFHHDEGVNGFFLTGLFRDGVYKYDPTNYHGPSLYYFALLSSWIFGLDDLAVRVVVAVFGFLTVALVFSLRRYLGTIGTRVAAALVAVSPGLTYFSRYFIHEILLVFFTFACAVCVLKFIEGERAGRIAIAAMAILVFTCVVGFGLQAAATLSPADDQTSVSVFRFISVIASAGATYIIVWRLARWDEGRPMYILLAAASASMTFTTKETSFISLGTMLIAIAFVCAWLKLSKPANDAHKNRTIGFGVACAVLAIVGIYFYADLTGGLKWGFETYFVNSEGREQPLIYFGIVVLFFASVEIARRLLTESLTEKKDKRRWSEPDGLTLRSFKERIFATESPSSMLYLGVITFVVVAVVFFSSFLTYEKGVNAAFEAYNIWAKTGSKDHAQNGTWAYLKWMTGVEAPIFILALLGLVIAFWKAQHRFAMFTALWGFGLFAAYTIIPYKTPWIAINFVLPMALTAGYAINELAAGREYWKRLAAKLLAWLAIAICMYQCVELNFFRFDDDRRPYVYVHSLRSMNEMMSRIDKAAKLSGKGDQITIIITSPENWPLPWTMNQYKKAGFFGSMVKTPDAEAIIGSKTQSAELSRDYGSTHVVAGTYGLRPGVDLLLYLRKDLAGN